MTELNTKTIEDIMLEMETLSQQQMAVTLTDEKVKELMDSVEYVSQYPPPCPEPTLCQCNYEIPYCCKVPIPKYFTENFVIADQRLGVVSCLVKFVDSTPCTREVILDGCPNPFQVNLFPVRIIGSIQFVASAYPLQGICGFNGVTTDPTGEFLSTDENERSVAISCQGSVCVNSIVNYVDQFAASNPTQISCSDIKVVVEEATIESCTDCSTNPTPCDNRVVVFKGKFILPTT